VHQRAVKKTRYSRRRGVRQARKQESESIMFHISRGNAEQIIFDKGDDALEKFKRSI
jgi:hypothetical protein